MVGGYFFLVMFITPKITTATKLSNNITSLMLTLSPPFGGTTCRPFDYMFIISWVTHYVNTLFHYFLYFLAGRCQGKGKPAKLVFIVFCTIITDETLSQSKPIYFYGLIRLFNFYTIIIERKR